MMNKGKNYLVWMIVGSLAIIGMAFATTISDSGSTFDDDITLDGNDLVLSGTSADITGTADVDIYPGGQTIDGLRVAVSGGEIVLSANGGTQLDFDDNINLLASKSILGASYITFYPDGQTTYGLRLDRTGTTPTLQSLGSTSLIFDDRLNLTQGFDVGTDKSIKLHSYTSDTIGDPQSIELYADHPQAKPYLAWKTWYDSDDSGTPDTFDWTAWLGAHYNTSITGTPHQHWSVETLDTDTGTINTRFEILLGLPVEDLFIGMNAINYLNLKTGVDVRFTESGTERARLEVNTTTKNLEITVPENKHIDFTTSGNGEFRFNGGNINIEDGKNVIADERIDFYPNDQFTRSITLEDAGSVSIIKSYGGDTLVLDEAEVKVSGVSSDGTGKAVCIKANGAFGTCTTAVGAGGTCTCA